MVASWSSKILKTSNVCISKSFSFFNPPSPIENKPSFGSLPWKPICFEPGFYSIISFDPVMRNLNFRILEFQSCSTGVEFEQYNSLVAQDDEKWVFKEIIVEYDYNYDLSVDYKSQFWWGKWK